MILFFLICGLWFLCKSDLHILTYKIFKIFLKSIDLILLIFFTLLHEPTLGLLYLLPEIYIEILCLRGLKTPPPRPP